ncbi:MAG: T9SS type A sorting domain-containing protein [Bacteroidia bacterium]
MKKILLSLIISGTSVCAFAQPTFDFETWTGSAASIEPNGWISANVLTGFGDPKSVFKDSLTPHSGKYDMKITSVTLSINPAPTSLPSPIGLAATGAVVGTTLKFGVPFTARPNSVSFWEKDSLVSGDNAEFFMCLTAWNLTTHKRDTLGFGTWQTGTTVNSYTMQTVTLTYTTSVEFPDSMAMIFSSTKLFNANYSLCLNCGTPGSKLWVDDISFAGWNGVNELEMSKGVSVFPNPTSGLATIMLEDVNDAYMVEVFDIAGRLIKTIPFSESANAVNKRSAVIPTQGMPAGLYSLSVYDKSEHLLRNGKLSVVK